MAKPTWLDIDSVMMEQGHASNVGFHRCDNCTATWEGREICNWIFECFEVVLWLHLGTIILRTCKQILYFPPARDGEVSSGINRTPCEAFFGQNYYILWVCW